MTTQTVSQRRALRRGLYEGRTEFHEAHYKFSRTCPGFYAPEKPDWIAPVTVIASVIFLITLFAIGVAV